MTGTASETRLAAPPRRALLGESRAAFDVMALAPRLLWRVPSATRPQEVIVLPGFGADDRSTWPLRHVLARAGHRVAPWGLGRNLAGLDIKHDFDDLPASWRTLLSPPARYRREGGVPMVCERMRDVVAARPAGAPPVVLVGWSLGGVVAREVARELPDRVGLVVTLGTPVVGGPKYTAAAKPLRERGLDLDWIERGIEKRNEQPIDVPIVAVVSPSDAIVAQTAAIDRLSARVRHVEIDAPHLSLCFRPAVWRIVLEAIERGG
jgi:pimeloyl-ACP methyl ester carboxylesterase